MYSSSHFLPAFCHLRPPKLPVGFSPVCLSFLKSEYLLIKGISFGGKHPTCLAGGLCVQHTLVSTFVLLLFLANSGLRWEKSFQKDRQPGLCGCLSMSKSLWAVNCFPYYSWRWFWGWQATQSLAIGINIEVLKTGWNMKTLTLLLLQGSENGILNI